MLFSLSSWFKVTVINIVGNIICKQIKSNHFLTHKSFKIIYFYMIRFKRRSVQIKPILPFFWLTNLFILSEYLCNLISGYLWLTCDLSNDWSDEFFFDYVLFPFSDSYLIPWCALLLSHLTDHQTSVVGFGGVNHPEAILIHSQVNVWLPAPSVWRGVMIVGISDNSFPTLYSCPEVILDDVPCAFFVVKYCAVVHNKPRTIHSVRQPVKNKIR